MKKIYFLFSALLALSIFSCKKDEETSSTPTTTDGKVIIQGDITGSVTWEADKKYLLKGFVYVTDGATLTIPAGTVVFGDKDTKGTLVVERGGKLIAEGTAEKPVVFTSSVAPGNRGYGDWGGLVLAGKAPINQVDPAMEGGIRGTYGGSDANDNSGSLKYVRIEFAGIAFQPDKEINGLTMYGVGAGTTIEHIQVSYCGDDSYEWFGGSVNAKYLIAHRGWDDEFDTDFGFVGKIQFGLSIRDKNFSDKSASNGFESDNFDPGTPATSLITAPVFANMTVYLADTSTTVRGGGGPTNSGSGDFGRSMHLRRNTKTSVFNSVFVGFPEGLRLDGNSTWDNVQAGELQLRGVALAGSKTYIKAVASSSYFTDGDVDTWFMDTDYKNEKPTVASLKLTGISSLTAPNPLPEAGSVLLDATKVVWDGKGADAFFEKVTYRGAFGTTNWTTGWANFNPQQTAY
ncbi:MAG: T9SS C-terminal target domain-containing protein [Thermonemataceae bacterium]|nr:T9SS C-terminal target domain-containing protein [Thermonemataceae bacterium]